MDFCDDCGAVVREGKCPKCSDCPKQEKCPKEESQEDVHKEDVSAEIKEKWEREQEELKMKMTLEDAPIIQEMIETVENGQNGVYYIAGVDISFVKGDDVNACSAFVVCSFPELKVVYEDYQMIQLTQPYIPGYLAFREVNFMIDQYNELKETKPKYLPQVIMVDGNGIIHPKGFGCACHLGVLLDIPCIGAAKTLFQVDGMEKDQQHHSRIQTLQKGGDSFPLIGQSGMLYGVALRSHNSAPNPIFVSPGHKISIASAKWLVCKCCRFRIPEPVRLADINSREYLRKHFKSENK